MTKNRWPSKGEAEKALAAAEAFRETTVLPALAAWREFRHSRALAFLGPAVDFYAERRRSEGRLNFQDQLMRAAKLLRERADVRRYFRNRFRPILVDEFQDTDPILSRGKERQRRHFFFAAQAPGSRQAGQNPHYETDDPTTKVIEFYKKNLKSSSQVFEKTARGVPAAVIRTEVSGKAKLLMITATRTGARPRS